MRLDIYCHEIDWTNLTRETIVYTPYGCDIGGCFEDCGYAHAPECFTTRRECLKHFWFRNRKGDYVAQEETLGGYVDRMMTAHDMNPFYTLAKTKTLLDNPHLCESRG